MHSAHLIRAVYDNVDRSLMDVSERLLLYALVFSLRPANCFEIGFYQGGSATVVLEALHDVATAEYPRPSQLHGTAIDDRTTTLGKLVSIDNWHPNLPELPNAAPAALTAPNFIFVYGDSRDPFVVQEAAALLDGPIDFCLLDGDHHCESVLADSRNVLPHMACGGILLYHDCRHDSVHRAIEELVKTEPTLVDGGNLSCISPRYGISADHWGGMRLLRVQSANRRAS